MLRKFEDSLDVVQQASAGAWLAARQCGRRLRWTDSSCNGVRWRSQHARRPPPAQQARPASGELGSGASRTRHVRGPSARPTGMSPTSSSRSLLSLCYDGGARGIPGRVTCRGRLRLEQRHRVDRDGRDDRDDGVDDEALRCVGVVRGAAHLRAARFAVVRREAGLDGALTWLSSMVWPRVRRKCRFRRKLRRGRARAARAAACSWRFARFRKRLLLRQPVVAFAALTL